MMCVLSMDGSPVANVSIKLMASGLPGRIRIGVLAFVASWLSLLGSPALADPAVGPETARSVTEWLTRMHDASRKRAYTGTLVVSTGSAISASRVWHVCDGKQQMERIETLTGAPRTTIRHNSDVITFVPDEKIAWVEKRDSLGLFPELLRAPANQIPEFYGVRERGVERIAGHLSDVVEIVPKDGLRFGYRVWSEQHTGLVMKLQTVDVRGQVLEQLAFTDLQLNAPVQMKKLARLMKDTRGYEVHRPAMRKTTPEAEGWQVKGVVPGFLLMSCHTREPDQPTAHEPQSMQCVYSDGLASVSLFFEPFQATSAQPNTGFGAIGATHTTARQIGPFRVTILGEVPPLALGQFAQAIERVP
jgi:sigma-E factor negative regulatory protein RseB